MTQININKCYLYFVLHTCCFKESSNMLNTQNLFDAAMVLKWFKKMLYIIYCFFSFNCIVYSARSFICLGPYSISENWLHLQRLCLPTWSFLKPTLPFVLPNLVWRVVNKQRCLLLVEISIKGTPLSANLLQTWRIKLVRKRSQNRRLLICHRRAAWLSRFFTTIDRVIITRFGFIWPKCYVNCVMNWFNHRWLRWFKW